MTALVPSPVYLLDFDEVVFRHSAAHAVVSRRVVSLVANRLNVGVAEATAVNRRLYGHHGHTLIGLRETLGLSIGLGDFNAEVYAPGTLREVARLPRPEDTDRRAEEVSQMLGAMRVAGVRPFIFSNAPRVWCEFALAEIGLSRAFTAAQMLTSDSYSQDIVLKPATLSYDLAQRYVGAGADAIAFVDDSMRNLASAPHAWRKFLMCNGDDADVGAASRGALAANAVPITRLDQLGLPRAH